jgi:uncharacterized protein YecT (DUF1311 family)
MRSSFRFLKSLPPALALLIAGIPLHAGEEKNPIDQRMEAAMEKDSSTAGMVQAVSKAAKEWDKEMNDLYQDLKKSMKTDEWADLVTAQKAWIAYRDAQTKSIVETYGHMDGTMYIPMSASDVMELTKDRALFLKSLKELISER